MKPGKAFEIFVKRLLMNVGFSEINSDGLYIFDGAAGQMIQGLGEAHNADVLLEPPVQTPFYAHTRILIECKDYTRKVGLNTMRSLLGLREDINNFDIVDINELTARRTQRRGGIIYNFERYFYQVAVAAFNGYTIPAQKFAVTHRIPILEFNKMPFWNEFCSIIHPGDFRMALIENMEIEHRINDLADEVGQNMAVAITNSGQMLFLYRANGKQTVFEDYYSLHWTQPELPWTLSTGKHIYQFQLPDNIMKIWLDNAANEIEMKKEAINCKTNFLSNMVVYYVDCGRPAIKMISINKFELEDAKRKLRL